MGLFELITVVFDVLEAMQKVAEKMIHPRVWKALEDYEEGRIGDLRLSITIISHMPVGLWHLLRLYLRGRITEEQLNERSEVYFEPFTRNVLLELESKYPGIAATSEFAS